ncbi:MAG: hypothetical protein QW186_08735 [Candidatus Bathyarchaeia archaeon]
MKKKFVIVAYSPEGREVVGEYPPSGRDAPGAPRYEGGGGGRWSKYQELLQDWLLEHKAVAYGEVYADEEGTLVFTVYRVK